MEMRKFQAFLGFTILVLTSSAALADTVMVKPDGCDFAVTFPAAPTQSQIKSKTDRGDDVVTNRADLKLDVNGKTDFFRIECTKIPHQGLVDEEILKENMTDLSTSYKLEGAVVSVDHNKLTGAVGHIQGRAKLGGKDITLRIDRYTSTNNILDVWTGAAPDAFPSDAGAQFLKTIAIDGQNLQ
jgi:hypothetical protein